MKKILCLIGCAVLVLFSGILLSACGDSEYLISLSVPQQQSELVELQVEIDNKKVNANADGKFQASSDSRVRIKFYAAQYGVDMSGLIVKANDKVRKIERFNTNFDSLHSSGDLYYGYIYLTNQQKDVTISVSGAKAVENKFVFESAENQDAAAQERMQKAQIRLPNQQNFQSFSEFIGSDNRSLNFNLLGQSDVARTFQLKFDGGDPYEVNFASPFQIQHADNSKTDLAAVDYSNGIYTFEIGDVQYEEEMKLVADFSSLKCREYELDLGSNLSYSVTIDSGKDFLDFETEATITVQKKASNVSFDMANLKAYLNNQPLEKASGQESATDTVKFVVPKWLTPTSTGGTDTFKFRLDGVNYGQSTYVLKAETLEEHSPNLISPEIYTLDENGENPGILGYNANGDVITFADRTNVLAWKYDLETGNYVTPYQIYNYDLMIDDDPTPVLNVDKIVKAHPEAESRREDISHILSGGMVFKAIYNADTNKYDSFKLEFKATKDISFKFANFQNQTKQIVVSQAISDSRILSVEYAIQESSSSDTSPTWKNISLPNDTHTESVQFGYIVLFRLQVKQKVEENEFRLAETIASNAWLDSETEFSDGKEFLILKFNVSDIFFDTPQNFKLVNSFAVDD